MSGLVIVESQGKVETINKFLGKKFKVAACMGHVRDLPRRDLGVDPEDGFKPKYVEVKDRAAVVKKLRALSKTADAIYLATDPDREGEAIAWHVTEVLKSDREIHRVTFNEITKDAVRSAIADPEKIDMRKVDAQQARRVLDRLVGYKVSPVLWSTVRKGLSAGRVQSVALRIICERQAEIDAFEPEEFWRIAVSLVRDGESDPILQTNLWRIDGKTKRIPNEETAKSHIEAIAKQSFSVKSLVKKPQKRRPSPPFITSTLQQEASRKMGYTAQRTMVVAQQLYEGIEVEGGREGLITYMRTDSTRIADEAVAAIRDYIDKRYGQKYLPNRPAIYKNRSNAQDAHEAVRPTNLDRGPESLKNVLEKDQLKLYTLIWNRFVSSQMVPMEVDVTTVQMEGGPYVLRAIDHVMTFDGFSAIYAEGKDDEDDERKDKIPADLAEGQRFDASKIAPEQKFTEPPPRYTEATLVKQLEAEEIGRPSTYASIVSTILEREYIEKSGSSMFPTELGIVVNRILVENFDRFFDTKFTASMERELDNIEQGNDHWQEMLSEFYSDFEKSLDAAKERKAELKELVVEQTDEVCEECGKPMVIRWGRRGKFLACTGFPDCRTTKSLDEEDGPQPTDYVCDECNAPMVMRTGRRGRFLSCSRYPECKTTRSIPTGVTCPECGEGELSEKSSKKGRTFYGCERYPDCKHAMWDKPVPTPCPQCDAKFVIEKTDRSGETTHRCLSCKAVMTVQPDEQAA